MKLNLDAIKNKIAALNGEGTTDTSNIQLWKPGFGEYRVRGMHWPSRLKLTNDGEPFVERHFYYNIAPYGFLAPAQFGKEDPVQELRMQLFKTKDPNDKIIAKKLFAQMYCYMPIVVKEGKDSDPDKVVIWKFNNKIYRKLLGYFVMDDVGDYLDPHEGFDLIVTISDSGKKFNNRTVSDFNIELARKPSALADDDDKVQEIFDSVPNINEMWSEKSTSEVKSLLDKWLEGDVDDNNQTDGTEKSSDEKSVDSLDELQADVEEAKAEEKKEKKKPAKKKAKKPEVSESDDELDSAFQELMDD